MALSEPRLGLVISYSYLWRRESERGREEGRKDRPCVIILSVEHSEAERIVTVVPVTHSRPADSRLAIELPLRVKLHLGLDDQPSWVMLDEGNRFLWPGYDLRPIKEDNSRFDYGFLPPRLFSELVQRFVAIWTAGQGKTIKRD